MRTIVDLPEEQVSALDKIGERDSLSRAELVRRAVDLYLSEHKKKKTGAIVGPDIRGLSKAGGDNAWDDMDATEWVRQMRSEWDERDRMYSHWGLNEKPQPDFTHKEDK